MEQLVHIPVLWHLENLEINVRIAFDTTELTGFINFGLDLESFKTEIDDGECTAIYAPHILDFIPNSHLITFLSALVGKMRHGCEITLGGSDVYETLKQFARGDIGLTEINQLLYGTTHPKKGQYTLNIISDFLQTKGLKILHKSLNGNVLCVKAVRE